MVQVTCQQPLRHLKETSGSSAAARYQTAEGVQYEELLGWMRQQIGNCHLMQSLLEFALQKTADDHLHAQASIAGGRG